MRPYSQQALYATPSDDAGPVQLQHSRANPSSTWLGPAPLLSASVWSCLHHPSRLQTLSPGASFTQAVPLELLSCLLPTISPGPSVCCMRPMHKGNFLAFQKRPRIPEALWWELWWEEEARAQPALLAEGERLKCHLEPHFAQGQSANY